MIEAIRLVVVVLPFVPVTPTSVSSRLGCPKKLAARNPIASRVSATTSCGRSTSIAVIDEQRRRTVDASLLGKRVTVGRAHREGSRTASRAAPAASRSRSDEIDDGVVAEDVDPIKSRCSTTSRSMRDMAVILRCSGSRCRSVRG